MIPWKWAGNLFFPNTLYSKSGCGSKKAVRYDQKKYSTSLVAKTSEMKGSFLKKDYAKKG